VLLPVDVFGAHELGGDRLGGGVILDEQGQVPPAVVEVDVVVERQAPPAEPRGMSRDAVCRKSRPRMLKLMTRSSVAGGGAAPAGAGDLPFSDMRGLRSLAKHSSPCGATRAV
jgi:hypothetical protein